ncbi:MAG: cytidine deaminase [Dysgonamonadaceae bacterium]|jgi:cytidine deaminase|nr:cytidine deaminase [Dysgonamonadaceae bacterium]
MKELKIVTKIVISSYSELNEKEKSLIDLAKNATKNAYAPYSKFSVGAAVLLDNGEMVTGNNQENIAYPSGLCAERVALYYANATFPNAKVEAIAVAAYFKGDFVEKISPCGACRQVLQETEDRYKSPIRILLYGKKEIYIVESANDLMPLSFSF